MADNFTAPVPNTAVVFDSKDIGGGVQRQRIQSLWTGLVNSQVITRPANTTAYTANNIVANSTTAGSVAYGTITVARETGAPVFIQRLRLYTNHTTGLAAVVFNVRLYTSAPSFTAGDGGAWAITTGGSGFIAKFQGTFEQQADQAWAELTLLTGNNLLHIPSGTTVTWDMQTLTAFTPQSAKTFTLFVEAPQGGVS